MDADELIDQLSLEPHPEGGWYRQTYRSVAEVQTERGARPASTAIYFLLQDDEFSALHRIASDEGWHFYAGSPLRVESILPDGSLECMLLGTNMAAGETLQGFVPAGRWFGASLVQGGYALVGCTVAPGFDFADFDMPSRQDLLSLFPHRADVIQRLTRP